MMKNTNKQPVDIVVLTYNRLEYLKTFIKYLYKHTRYPFRLIVVDNGSIDGSREYILKLKKDGVVWKSVFTDNNMKMAMAFTEGYKLVESDLFITVADDMMAPNIPGKYCWLEVFVHKINNDNNIGCINFVAARRSYSIFKKKYDRE